MFKFWLTLAVVLFALFPFFLRDVTKKRYYVISMLKQKIVRADSEWIVVGARITEEHIIRRLSAKDYQLVMDYITLNVPSIWISDEEIRIYFKGDRLQVIFRDGKIVSTIEAGRKSAYVPPPGPDYEWAYAARSIAINTIKQSKKVKRQSA